MKSTAWLRVVVVFVVLLGLAGALLQRAVSSPDDLEGLALNLGTELIGAALTYVLFELVIGRIEKREAEEKELEAKKADLIAQMGSSVKDVAIPAVEELWRHNWVCDGSLRGVRLDGANLEGVLLSGANLQGTHLGKANLQDASLSGANLQEAVLFMTNLQRTFLDRANLEGANLGFANLQGANLGFANLQGANLELADLKGANLRQANLEGASLESAKLKGIELSRYTTLPDGTKWTPDTNMARFTDPDHPDFWWPEP